MRLLLDQNLSPRLVPALVDLYPGSAHVREVGLQTADDDMVWRDAAEHGFVVVSKDADFHASNEPINFIDPDGRIGAHLTTDSPDVA